MLFDRKIPPLNDKGKRMYLYLLLKKYYAYILLLIIVIISAAFRVSGLNWGFFHPDEFFYTHIAWDFYQGKLNFGFRPADWPNIIHYAIFAILYLIHFISHSDIPSNMAIIIGRYISVILSTFTVILCYLVGKKIHSVKVGLLSALFFAIAQLSVLHAHYATMDSAATFFFTLTLFFAIKLGKNTYNNKILVITGILAGITIGIKYTGGIILIPTIMVILFNKSFPLVKRIQNTTVFLIISVLSFLIINPFALINPGKFIKSFSESSNFAVGFYGLFPEFGDGCIAWYLKYGISWSYGLIYATVIVISIVYLLIKGVQKKDVFLLILPTTIFLYLGYLSLYDAYLMRYLLLITPIFAVSIALCINDICDAIAKKLKNQKKWIVSGIPVIFVILLIIQPLIFTLAYNNILSEKNVRVQATEWIESNIDKNDTIDIGPSPPPPSWMLPLIAKSSYVSQPVSTSGSDYFLVCEPLADNIYLRYLQERNLYLDEDFAPQKPPSDEILNYYSTLTYDNRNYELVAVFNKTPNFLGYVIDESNAPYEVTHVTHPELKIYKKVENVQTSNKLTHSR